MKGNYLTNWKKCDITDRQGAMLVMHLGGDQRLPICGRDNRTSLSLIERGWLRIDGMAGMTSLTENGKHAALHAAAVIADRLAPSPPLVPLPAESIKETV